MSTPELPPVRRYDLCLRGYENTMKRADDGDYCDNEDREARERILQARIAELERLWRLAEDRYALADASDRERAKRVAELQDEVKDLREAAPPTRGPRTRSGTQSKKVDL